MQCKYHPEYNAVATCADCGASVCKLCRTQIKGKVYCLPCFEKIFVKKCKYHPEIHAVAECADCGANICKQCRTRIKGKIYCLACFQKIYVKKGLLVQQALLQQAKQTEEDALDTTGKSYWKNTAALSLALACGIITIVGLFLPWLNYYGQTTISAWNVNSYIGETIITFEPYTVLAGSIAMILCTVLAVIISINNKEDEDTMKELAKYGSMGAWIPVLTMIWVLVDWIIFDFNVGAYISYGVHISFGASIFGLAILILQSR